MFNRVNINLRMCPRSQTNLESPRRPLNSRTSTFFVAYAANFAEVE
jgi:hypothetical protein